MMNVSETNQMWLAVLFFVGVPFMGMVIDAFCDTQEQAEKMDKYMNKILLVYVIIAAICVYMVG